MIWDKYRPRRTPSAPGASRRAVLGGAAAALTLPWLESLAAEAAAPVRTVFWYLPNGVVMDHWRPAATGELKALPRILAPLDGLQSDLLVISGLANRAAQVPVPGDHARGTGSFLTCRECKHTAGEDIRNGISIDQVIAAQVGDQTLFDSVELGTTGGSSFGDCDSGYSCAYSRNISWLDADTPRPKLTDPQLVFDRLFAGFDTTETEAERARRRAFRTSVLDHVMEDAHKLAPRLPASDRNKLDEYMTGVRAVEARIQAGQATCAPGSRPSGGLDYAATVRAMSDLTVLALRCDLTRVVTFMLENGGSYRSFDFLGVSGAHHELSHHQREAAKLEALTTIDTWEIGELAYLVRRLQETPDAGGQSLLANTLVTVSSEISDGDWHNHDDLPVLLAGQGGGAFRTGRHVAFTDEQPIADLFISLASAAGAPVSSFGQDGTRPLPL